MAPPYLDFGRAVSRSYAKGCCSASPKCAWHPFTGKRQESASFSVQCSTTSQMLQGGFLFSSCILTFLESSSGQQNLQCCTEVAQVLQGRSSFFAAQLCKKKCQSNVLGEDSAFLGTVFGGAGLKVLLLCRAKCDVRFAFCKDEICGRKPQ